MAIILRHPLYIRAAEEFWRIANPESGLFRRQDTTGVCAGACGTSSNCYLYEDLPGAYTCCVKGAGATGCQAHCPPPYRACSRSCCQGICEGDEPFAVCASVIIDTTSEPLFSIQTKTDFPTTTILDPSPSFTTFSVPPFENTPSARPSTTSDRPSSTSSPAGSTTTSRPLTSSSSSARESSSRTSQTSNTESSTSSTPRDISISSSSSTSQKISISSSSSRAASTSSITTKSSTPTSLGNTENEGGSGGLSTGAKAAIGVVIPLIAIIIIIALILFLRRKRKAKKEDSSSSAAPELHGNTRATPELAIGNAQSPYELQEKEGRGIGYIAPLLAEKKQEEEIAAINREAQELPDHHDQETSAMLSGPPTFEMPADTSVLPPVIVVTDEESHNESSSRTNNRNNEIIRPLVQARELSGISSVASVNAPPPPRVTTTITQSNAPIRRKQVPTSPLRDSSPISPVSDSSNDVGTGYIGVEDDEEEEIEKERQALEERRKRIAAEREHLRRMRELDEEESEIQNRLSSLRRSKTP